MAISPKTVSEMNAAIQNVPLPGTRIDELPVELNQLLAAAVANRARLDFDTDPSDFRRSLTAAKG